MQVLSRMFLCVSVPVYRLVSFFFSLSPLKKWVFFGTQTHTTPRIVSMIENNKRQYYLSSLSLSLPTILPFFPLFFDFYSFSIFIYFPFFFHSSFFLPFSLSLCWSSWIQSDNHFNKTIGKSLKYLKKRKNKSRKMESERERERKEKIKKRSWNTQVSNMISESYVSLTLWERERERERERTKKKTDMNCVTRCHSWVVKVVFLFSPSSSFFSPSLSFLPLIFFSS